MSSIARGKPDGSAAAGTHRDHIRTLQPHLMPPSLLLTSCLAACAFADTAAAGYISSGGNASDVRTSAIGSMFVHAMTTIAAVATPPLNSVDTVIDDMKRPNDFVLKGYESFTTGWYVGPGETHMGNNPSFSNTPTWSSFHGNPDYAGVVAKAVLPWLVILDGVKNQASNVGVEMRNMRTYLKSKATGKWSLLGGPVKATGTYYGKPATGLPAMDEVVVSSSATGSVVKVPENNAYFWHGWWGAGRMTINPSDIAALFVTVQARLVVADSGRQDDRSKAEIGLQVGADYYVDKRTVYKEIAPAVGISRTKKLTKEWQAFSYITLSDVGTQMPGGGITAATLRAAPPPLD